MALVDLITCLAFVLGSKELIFPSLGYISVKTSPSKLYERVCVYSFQGHRKNDLSQDDIRTHRDNDIIY